MLEGCMIELLDEAFFGPSWHGPSLLGALRGLTDTQAAWRPDKKRHNIWELTLHAAYWKYIARRRLTGQKERFPVKGSNWFVRPADGRKWKEDVALLINEHERLRDVVIAVPKTELTQRLGDGRYTKGHLIRGIAAHDLYHAGQIQLLKRLQSGGSE
jgi:DinB superfamily